MTDQRRIEISKNWLRTHSCVGAKCGNCGKSFTVARAVKGIVGIPNGAGYSVYVLCRRCARRFKSQGPKGIPNAVRDAKLATRLWFIPARGNA